MKYGVIFSVETAIDENNEASGWQTAATNTKSVRTHAKVTDDHRFSLSLSRVEGRHDNGGDRKICVSNPCYFEDSSVPTDV